MTDFIDRICKPWTLAKGVGVQGESGCWMAYAAYATEGDWHDHPECVCPVISTICIAINDGLSDDRRAEVILPRLYDPIGTAQGDDITRRRMYLCADRAIRVFAADALDCAGIKHGLRDLPEVVCEKSAARAADAADVARAAVAADAADVARAAVAAERSAARSVAQAARSARSVAQAAAWSAPWSAPWSALSEARATEKYLIPLLDDLLAIGADDRQPVREVKSEAERFAAMGWQRA